MVLLIASERLICPSMQFSQVGELESSKICQKVEAPEFKSIDNHFLSTGPVISTLLSCKSLGNLLHTQ